MSHRSRALVQRMLDGDTQALEALLQQHLPGLRAYVRLRSGKELRAKESAADVVQSVCREVLQHMDRFRYPSEAGFKQWLYLTALRKIRNRYEHYHAAKRDADREVPIQRTSSAASQVNLLDCYGSFCTPSRHLMAQEEIERIEATFDKLPDDYREAITLAKVVGMSRAEMAEHMGRSEGSVRTLLSRALARLAELLDTDD